MTQDIHCCHTWTTLNKHDDKNFKLWLIHNTEQRGELVCLSSKNTKSHISQSVWWKKIKQSLEKRSNETRGENALEELLAGGGGVRAVGHVICAVDRVPRVVAILPGQVAPKRAEHVVQRPRDYNIIICAHDERDGHRCHANTWRMYGNTLFP